MNMPATKIEVETATPAGASAPVVAMTLKRPPRREAYARMARETAVRVIPPLVVSPSEIDEGLHRLDAALSDLESGKGVA